MSQQRLIGSPEKTEQQIAFDESRPDSARSFQGGLHPIPQLQRTLGNRNVAKLIQAKQLTPEGKIIGFQRNLTVGAADDQYEQEADQVARQVLNTPDAMATAFAEQAPSLRGAQNQALLTKPLAASIAPIVRPQVQRDPVIARDVGTDVDTAGQKAADAYRPPGQVVTATNVDDVNQAKRVLDDARTATATLQPAIGQEGWGERVEQKHVAANQGLISNLEDYLTYAGEESRTTTDFQARYVKATQQFQRLSGMVEQYSATAGVDVGDAAALVDVETGGSAEAAGAAVNKAAKGKGGEDLRNTRNRVKDLRLKASELKEGINSADHAILSRKKDVIIAAASAAKTAADREKDPKEPDSEAVKEVKSAMEDVKKYMSVGIEAGKAAIPFDALPKPAAKAAEKAADIAIDKVVDAALEEIYRSELEKAKAVQTKASSISKHAQDTINVANVQKGANDLVSALDAQHAKAAQFDQLMSTMRDAIREMGQAADNTIKTGGYAVMAQFLSESDVYLNEVEVAISAGKVQQTAGTEATGAHVPLDVKKDPQKGDTLVYYSASKVGEKYEVLTVYVHLNRGGAKSAQGDQGINKTVELMLKDLDADKNTVEQYRDKLNKAFGL